jgi:hypothetical protein
MPRQNAVTQTQQLLDDMTSDTNLDNLQQLYEGSPTGEVPSPNGESIGNRSQETNNEQPHRGSQSRVTGAHQPHATEATEPIIEAGVYNNTKSEI